MGSWQFSLGTNYTSLLLLLLFLTFAVNSLITIDYHDLTEKAFQMDTFC